MPPNGIAKWLSMFDKKLNKHLNIFIKSQKPCLSELTYKCLVYSLLVELSFWLELVISVSVCVSCPWAVWVCIWGQDYKPDNYNTFIPSFISLYIWLFAYGTVSFIYCLHYKKKLQSNVIQNNNVMLRHKSRQEKYFAIHRTVKQADLYGIIIHKRK